MKVEVSTIVATAFLAIVGWGITHIVDRLTESPILAYDITFNETPNGKRFKVVFRNLARNQNFANVEIVFISEREDRFSNPKSVADPPGWDATAQLGPNGDSVTFKFDQFQPGWVVSAAADYTGRRKPQVRLVRSTSNPVKLVESGVTTFVIQKEMHILLFVIVVALIGAFMVIKKAR
ncbi:MAG: hypothetical protein IID55_06570 [Proteobacteria bacterium]|nr:hypothetical protein [Pseudomonadota bacterium]